MKNGVRSIVGVEDPNIRRFLRRTLEHWKWHVEDCFDHSQLLLSVERNNPSLLFLGLPATQCPFGAAKRIRVLAPNCRIILITTTSSEDAAVAALRAGFNNYFRFPGENDTLHQYLRDELALASLSNARLPASGLKRLVGKSRFVSRLKLEVMRTAATDGNVLITGETGTGKELVAELIHQISERQRFLFDCINCAAIPDTLLETELFGHERGAFTGAVDRYDGKLRLAEKGTIFFDEIGDMSMIAQAKVLRILEGKPYHRLGGQKLLLPNVRFITATNLNIEDMVVNRQFRKDLFFRINVHRIHLIPLRDRIEDIPLLLENMIAGFNDKYNRRVSGIARSVLQLFFRYEWPGNVRELMNLIEASYANSIAGEIQLADLPSVFIRNVTRVTPTQSEQDRLLEILRATDWNLSKAARELSLSRMTIYRKMAKFHISRDLARAGNHLATQ